MHHSSLVIIMVPLYGAMSLAMDGKKVSLTVQNIPTLNTLVRQDIWLQ